jgi:hypothetical protein
MNKFGKFLKGVFVDKIWIKLIAILLAVFIVIMLNI